jgi:hypothetical protein
VLLRRPEWLRCVTDLHCQAAWWLGVTEAPSAPADRHSRLFADAGVAVMTHGNAHIVIKAGPFGEGSGGHSHADVLSLVVQLGDREILIDPGTYTYIADPAARNAFRGTAAHNTVRIAGRDQALPAGPFRWHEKPEVRIDAWRSDQGSDFLDARCQYGGLTHRRRVLFHKIDAVLLVVDSVEGPDAEQFWHLGSAEDAARFSFAAQPERIEGWRSRALCSREPAPVLRVAAPSAAVIDLGSSPAPSPVRTEDGRVIWRDRTYVL